MRNTEYYWCFLFLIFLWSGCQAQSSVSVSKIFDRDHVNKIEIKIDSSHLNEIMTQPFEEIIHPAEVLVHFEKYTDSIKNIGFRIKGNASRRNGKKSFKLDINEYDKTQQYEGMDKINLNGFWNDPTHIRSLLVTEAYESLRIPVSDQGFCELYINGTYFGLYNVVENVDKEFIVKHFTNPTGNLYKCDGLGNLVFPAENKDTFTLAAAKHVLKSNKKIADHTAFYHFLDVLNNSSDEDFACAIEQVFDVELYIKILAVDFITGNWDSYAFTKNNYYLYYNPSTYKFEYIPFDFDNSFGMDWLGQNWADKNIFDWYDPEKMYNHPDFINLIPQSKNYKSQIDVFVQLLEEGPLYERILGIDAYKTLYVYYLNKLINGYLNPEQIEERVDALMTLLLPYVEKDNKDNFDQDQISLAIDTAITDLDGVAQNFHNYLLFGIKPFIHASVENTADQLQNQKLDFIITEGKLKWDPCAEAHE